MPTLLTPDLVAPLERHARVALAAQVGHDRTLQRDGAVCREGVLVAAAHGGGDLVGFAGHVLVVSWGSQLR